MLDLPLHPAVVHFPVAGAFFAAGALALALWKPVHRLAALAGAALLLAATVAGGVAALVTGWRWADQLAYLAGGWGPIPGPKAVEGLAQRHALLALGAVAAAALAFGLALAARRRGGSPVPALLAALLACALMGATAHAGGTMVHAPPEPDHGVWSTLYILRGSRRIENQDLTPIEDWLKDARASARAAVSLRQASRCDVATNGKASLRAAARSNAPARIALLARRANAGPLLF